MPRGKVGEVSLMLKAVHASESLKAARSKAKENCGETEEDVVGVRGEAGDIRHGFVKGDG